MRRYIGEKLFTTALDFYPSLFRDNFHQLLPYINLFTFQITGVGSKVKEVQVDTGVRRCWKLTRNSWKATDRTCGNTVYIRKRHSCLQMGRPHSRVNSLGEKVYGNACPLSPIVGKKESRKVKSLSHVWLFATPWTVAYKAPLSMGFSRQEYWSGLPFLQGIFLTQGSNPGLPHCRQTLYHLSHQGSPRESQAGCK